MKKLMALAITMMMVVVVLVGLVVADTQKTEVETYTVGCEVAFKEYNEKMRECYLFVRNDDFMDMVMVDSDTFDEYKEGDIVEVEVRVMESLVKHTISEEYRVV